MPLLCKQKALYVKGCVIPNGVQDSQGDTLYAEDIKKIFTSFNNQDNFEIYHEDNPIPEVSLLENYISVADETLGTNTVPSGSWNVVIRVDNPEIQQGLLNGELGGLSLSNRIAPRCKGNLKGTIRYKDIPDAECVVPRFISFVEGGANGYGLHVYDYDAYILKSKDVEFNEDGGKIMDFKEFLNGLKSLIKEAEAPVEEEPAIEKEETEEEAEVTVEETAEEEAVEETETEATEEPAAIEKEDTEAAEEEPAEAPAEEEAEPVIEKEDEETEVETEAEAEETEEKPDLEARVAAFEEIIAELKAEKEEEETEEEAETPDPEVEPEDEDTPKITKSEKVIIEEETTVETSNYYEMTGRDPLTGKKIRK